MPVVGWVCIGAALLSGAALWLLVSKPKQDTTSLPTKRHGLVFAAPSRELVAQVDAGDEELVTVRVSGRGVADYKIPAPPRGYGHARWLKHGESIDVQGVRLPGGFIYVGTSLTAPNGGVDPCLIDPKKQLSAAGNFTIRQTDYWPNYANITPAARKAYLTWLSGGRQHPEADIGYVFLFFYGLERRVLIDGASDVAAKQEFTTIAQELRRLLQIYGGVSNSFRFYAGALLNWLELSQPPPRLYSRPVPDLPTAFEVPFYLRVALGQAAVDHSPISAPLAFAWIKSEPSTKLRTAAKRCAPEFSRLFEQKYRAAFGDGLVVPPNKTKLKFYYRPASAGFRGAGEFSSAFGDLPDVTAVTTTVRNLQKLVEAATSELEPFSRLVGRQPAAASSIDGLALLPGALWPPSATAALREIRTRMRDGLLRLKCNEFLAFFGASALPPRTRLASFARALESQGLGLEPDIAERARPPKLDESVVVFEAPLTDARLAQTPAYLVAELTLQIASSVAASDGSFGIEEVHYLRKQIDGWHHLGPNQQRRLHAHLAILEVEPKSTTGMKKRLEPVSQAVRETIATIIVNLAHSDGVVSPEEVRTIEKTYRLLGVEPKRVFSDVHAAASRGHEQPKTTAPQKNGGFKLDPERIAQLQDDTNRVSAMLSEIFAEPEPETESQPADDAIVDDSNEPGSDDSILDLDGPTSAFARLVMSRPRWTRAELQDVVTDMELMLDGTIERINEASFSRFDIAFLEGDDPLEVNAEIIERLEA